MIGWWVENFITPTGISTAVAFGTPEVRKAGIYPENGIASLEAFGTPAITVGAVTITPTGIASAEAFGSDSLSTLQEIDPTGIGTEEAFGTCSLTAIHEDLGFRPLIFPNKNVGPMAKRIKKRPVKPTTERYEAAGDGTHTAVPYTLPFKV